MTILDSYNSFDGAIESRIGGRPENQDNYGFAQTPYGMLIVVCDGMGGGPGGKFASSTTVDVVLKHITNASSITPEKAIKEAVAAANEALSQLMIEYPSLKGMGTTIAAIILGEDSAVIAHIGDSRVYKLRRHLSLCNLNEIVFRTKDHSMVGEMVRQGSLTEEQARLSANTNIITRAIGANSFAEPDIEVVSYEKGDRFLLCTDGIWGQMPEKELVENACLDRNVTTIVERIANLADKRGLESGGHHDNLTIAVIETKTDSKQIEPMNKKAKRIIAGVSVLLIVSLISILYFLCQQYNNKKLESELKDTTSSLLLKNKQIEELKKKLEGTKAELEKKNSYTFQEEVKALSSESQQQQSQPQTNNEDKPTTSVKETNEKFMDDAKNLFKKIKDFTTVNPQAWEKERDKNIAQINKDLNQIKQDELDDTQKTQFNKIKEIIKNITWDQESRQTRQGKKVIKIASGTKQKIEDLLNGN